MSELLLAFGGVVVGWLWHDSMRARERATAACRRACRGLNAQLLDETVALDRLRLVRDRGRLTVDRRYRFEFSMQGDDRRAGWIRLAGRHVVALQMEHAEGLTVLSPPDG